MPKLPTDLFARYCEDPLGLDTEVRRFMKVPEDRYYTVSIWPEARAGQLQVTNQTRTVKTPKVSKSHQS
jgi:hypothetical protein